MHHQRRVFTLTLGAIGISATLAVAGCTSGSSGSDDEVATNPNTICEFWSGDEYDDAVDEVRTMDESISGSLASGIVDAAALSRRCTDSWVFHTTTLPRNLKTTANLWEDEDYIKRDDKLLPTYYEKYLTVKGLLAGWSTNPILDLEDKSESYVRDQLKETQKIIGSSLAKATDISRDEHVSEEFTSDLRKLAKKRIPIVVYSSIGSSGYKDKWKVTDTGPTVYGWSILAPLLRHGDFHEDFLVPVATDIIEFDQKHKGDWKVKGEKSVSFDMFEPDAKTGMDAVLEALSRNETAAKQVAENTGDERVEELLTK